MSDLCAKRNSDVLLRAMGGRSVMLRMPAPAVPADPTEQLGLATPLFQDAVEVIVGSLAYASASVLFAQAFGVLCDGELLEIISATSEQAFGQPYVYRLVVLAPLAQIT
jgi:hypothetical protein